MQGAITLTFRDVLLQQGEVVILCSSKKIGDICTILLYDVMTFVMGCPCDLFGRMTV